MSCTSVASFSISIVSWSSPTFTTPSMLLCPVRTSSSSDNLPNTIELFPAHYIDTKNQISVGQ